MDGQPNGWAALIELIKTLAPIVAAVAAFLTWRGNQRMEPKIDQTHENTNGKSDKQEARIAELEAHIEDIERQRRG